MSDNAKAVEVSSVSKSVKKRNFYMDVMRVVSCLLILCGHCTAFNWEDAVPSSTTYEILNINDNIFAMGVPLFIMMSGALHLNENYKLTIKNLLVKKVLRMLTTYYGWLLYYNIIKFASYHLPWTFANIKFHIFGQLVRGNGIYHLWFLPKIVLMYFITPLIKDSLKNKKICEYCLILYTVFIIFIPTMFAIGFPGKDWIEFNFDTATYMAVTSTIGYMAYYILGHYAHSFIGPLNKLQLALCYIGFIGSIGIATILGSVRTAASGVADVTFINPLYIFEFVAGFCLFLLFKEWCRKAEDKETPKWIPEVGKLTFGIYLFHPTILMQAPKFNISMIEPTPLLMVPLTAIVLFTLSGLVSWVLNKIPVVNKWLL